MFSDETKRRCVEAVREHAAVSALTNHEFKCQRPKSVEFFKIDEHKDVWGQSDKCIYRVYDGQCYRYPFLHEAAMALEILTRGKKPVAKFAT